MPDVIVEDDLTPRSMARTAVLLLGASVAAAIYFQLHVTFGSSLLNVNLADPLAVLAFSIVCWQIVWRRQLPQWRVQQFNLVIVALSALLVLGFAIGWTKIGVTFWALNGRMIGWCVILGYLSAGYLTVAYAGTKGLRLLSETLVTSAVVIVLSHAVSRYLYQYGWDVGLDPPPNFEGFSGNRNAFVFQLLTAVGLLLAYSPVYLRSGRGRDRARESKPAGTTRLQETIRTIRRIAFLLGALLVGIVWTGSRAGMLVGGCILLLAAWIGLLERKTAFFALIFGGGLWGVFWLIERLMPPPEGQPVASALWQLPVHTNLFVCAALLLFATWRRLAHPIASALLVVVILSSGVWFARNSAPVAGVTGGAPRTIVKLQSALSNDISNQERFETFKFGLELWKQSPLLGAGLGVFYAKSPAWLGHSQVIHSTPLWLLAEFGLVGIGVLSWAAFLLSREALPALSRVISPATAGLLMMLLIFGLFSQAHEMFFQRIIWLVLGALLALPCTKERRK